VGNNARHVLNNARDSLRTSVFRERWQSWRLPFRSTTDILYRSARSSAGRFWYRTGGEKEGKDEEGWYAERRLPLTTRVFHVVRLGADVGEDASAVRLPACDLRGNYM